ncbi:hypothetical protein LCGC14_2630450 [marine sediment metagenome]|uniref:Fibronectin type-III domain-containing protein n=1 Tax=marine sediment metagenome TaxID=412755 RepID=A0A0F9A0B4_9ZZZZ
MAFEHLKAVVTKVTRKRNIGAFTLSDQILTGVPTSITCTSHFGGTIHVTQVRVGWQDNTGGALKHRVYYRVSGATTWILATPSGVAAGTTTYDVTALDPVLVYQFAVTSWTQSTGTESTLSAIVTCFTTLRNTFIYHINETILAA